MGSLIVSFPQCAVTPVKGRRSIWGKDWDKANSKTLRHFISVLSGGNLAVPSFKESVNCLKSRDWLMGQDYLLPESKVTWLETLEVHPYPIRPTSSRKVPHPKNFHHHQTAPPTGTKCSNV